MLHARLDKHYDQVIPGVGSFSLIQKNRGMISFFQSYLQASGFGNASEPSHMVKVTLTEWIKDQQPVQQPVIAEQLPSRNSDADLAAAIEASKLTAPGPYWDAQILDDRERYPPTSPQTSPHLFFPTFPKISPLTNSLSDFETSRL